VIPLQEKLQQHTAHTADFRLTGQFKIVPKSTLLWQYILEPDALPVDQSTSKH